ncbi:hypothetical protein [Xanthobacter autotrophicus]|uniref:hypothetical protein n=1 Tax=Xanthobacter autotrophicus TaxID=280 RepID=UPI00372B6F7E
MPKRTAAANAAALPEPEETRNILNKVFCEVRRLKSIIHLLEADHAFGFNLNRGERYSEQSVRLIFTEDSIDATMFLLDEAVGSIGSLEACVNVLEQREV